MKSKPKQTNKPPDFFPGNYSMLQMSPVRCSPHRTMVTSSEEALSSATVISAENRVTTHSVARLLWSKAALPPARSDPLANSSIEGGRPKARGENPVWYVDLASIQLAFAHFLPGLADWTSATNM